MSGKSSSDVGERRLKGLSQQWQELAAGDRGESKGSASSGGSLLLVMGRMLRSVLCLLSFQISQL